MEKEIWEIGEENMKENTQRLNELKTTEFVLFASRLRTKNVQTNERAKHTNERTKQRTNEPLQTTNEPNNERTNETFETKKEPSNERKLRNELMNEKYEIKIERRTKI